MATAPTTANGNNKTIEADFAARIYHAIATANSAENVIISPLLLEAALALLYLGSDGATAEELRAVLQLKRFSNNAKMANYYAGNLDAATATADTQLQLSNALLLDARYALAAEFQNIARKYFHTTTATQAQQVRAETMKALLAKIAANSTKVSALLQTNAAATSHAILLIAARFQHKWFLPFSAYRTGIYEFHLSAAVQKPVPMLYDDDMFVKFGEFRELDARAIELPFEHHDDELAMLLVLPNKRNGLADLLQQLQTVDLAPLTERMQMESVQVLLPKFSIDFECSLRQHLEATGISTIFTKASNFKNLLQEGSAEALPLDDILHKVCIEVHESGSDAPNLAPHKPIVISNSIDSRHKFFRADHPFYFAVRNGAVNYFVGHVTKF